MRVRMSVQISGTRNGREWPGPGGEIDLPEDEAMPLCQARLATPVAVPAANVEVREEPKAEAPRKRGRPRKNAG